MEHNTEFEDIRPYYDEEVNAALKRIVSEPEFAVLTDYLFPDTPKENIISTISNIHTAAEFQKQFMHPAVRAIINKSASGLTSSGFDNIKHGNAYVFISNHRDIVLDSAILQILLVEHGFETTEITFGSNLMLSPFIVDLEKVNRMVMTSRNGTKREMLANFKRLSSYIRHTITDKKTSIWIAHRNGRTKDGNDKTQEELLKMFNMSGNGDFTNSFDELNITPVSISYEYEPCDVLKIQELCSSMNSSYNKNPGEDLKSIITGITTPKGRIHLSVGVPIKDELIGLNNLADNKDKIKKLALLIDNQIYDRYKLWPSNYIAADLLSDESEYFDFYTPEEKEIFCSFVTDRLKNLNGNSKLFKQMFLKLYANPVYNFTGSNITS